MDTRDSQPAQGCAPLLLDANGEVAELRATDVNRALYKMWKTDGKVIADNSGV